MSYVSAKTAFLAPFLTPQELPQDVKDFLFHAWSFGVLLIGILIGGGFFAQFAG